MFEFLMDFFEDAGYELSVVLAFNQPDIHFMQEEDLLLGRTELIGLGLSAFSVANGYFYSNTGSFADYYTKIGQGVLPIAQGRALDKPTEMAMSVIHGLRFRRIDGDAFYLRFGLPIEQVFGSKLTKLVDGELLERRNNTYELTKDGMICLGAIMREFYREEPMFDKTYQGDATLTAAAS